MLFLNNRNVEEDVQEVGIVLKLPHIYSKYALIILLIFSVGNSSDIYRNSCTSISIQSVKEIGVSTEAISIVMGLYSLVGMMQTCTNVTGDAVVTTVVAKSEGMLDTQIYYSDK